MSASCCTNPKCGHLAEVHPAGGPCAMLECPCYALEGYTELTFELSKAKKSKANLDVLAACYCCGRVGCSVSRCPYFTAAKKMGLGKH